MTEEPQKSQGLVLRDSSGRLVYPDGTRPFSVNIDDVASGRIAGDSPVAGGTKRPEHPPPSAAEPGEHTETVRSPDLPPASQQQSWPESHAWAMLLIGALMGAIVSIGLQDYRDNQAPRSIDEPFSVGDYRYIVRDVNCVRAADQITGVQLDVQTCALSVDVRNDGREASGSYAEVALYTGDTRYETEDSLLGETDNLFSNTKRSVMLSYTLPLNLDPTAVVIEPPSIGYFEILPFYSQNRIVDLG